MPAPSAARRRRSRSCSIRLAFLLPVHDKPAKIERAGRRPARHGGARARSARPCPARLVPGLTDPGSADGAHARSTPPSPADRRARAGAPDRLRLQFTEGPIWHPVDHYLLFSDMPGDVRRRWDRQGVREVMRPSNKGNGMTYDADLNLLVCEHATSSVVRFRPDGGARCWPPFRGARAQQPERHLRALRRLDLFLRPVVRAHAASTASSGRASSAGRACSASARRQVGGEPQLLVDRYTVHQPNGLCFSPDERCSTSTTPSRPTSASSTWRRRHARQRPRLRLRHPRR
jgi:hypothetical protein